MDFRHLIVTCLFSKLRLPFDNQKVKENYAIFSWKNADLYLSTSRFEGLPYALIEAASVGLPIVATDVVGNNEVVLHDYNGLVFKTEQEAVDAIKKLSINADLLNRYSINSRELYLKTFTMEKMISSIVDTYVQVLNQ